MATTSNQSLNTPGSAPADKTDMKKVAKVASGPVDAAADSKPKMPTAELNKYN